MSLRRSLEALAVLIFIGIIVGAIWQLRTGYEEDATSVSKHDKIRLRFTYWGSVEEKKAIENAMAKFMERYPWIVVDTIQLPNSDYNTKLTAMSASNEEPDLGYMTTELGEVFASQDKFMNLYDFLERDPDLSKEDFLDYLWYKQADDYAWGVSSAAECFGLFYRRDLLAAAGVAPPSPRAEEAWTWDEFVKAAQKLTLDHEGRNALHPAFDKNNIAQYGVMFETWSEPISNFVFSNGGQWIDPEGATFKLNEPEAAEAIQKLADLVNVYHVAPSPFETKSMPAMNVSLQAGLTAMIIDGQWINLDLGKAEVDYDIGVLPKMKQSVTVGLAGASVIFKSTKHPEEAWLLLKWLADPNEAIELYTSGLWMPTLKKWYTEPELINTWVNVNSASHPPGFKDAMLTQLMDNGVQSVGYYMKNQSVIYPIVTSELVPVWLGKKSAQEALDEISRKVEPLFQQSK
ncbi:ABC transporter substrate-binding protein [Paenibacillus fonticola]|uniref:ABC transporter substrate-binding protein n=1 Tax=Paenibacillus fonticola TaxID=379896 RepID=UPI00035CA625|nr:sugar ABC transporter substrate-binding protein [Paenibacillus fonticola]